MPTRCNRGFYCRSLLLAQHVSVITMPIIRSSRVLYSGCCLWYFVLWLSSYWSGVELRVMCPVCRMLQHPANRTHNPKYVEQAIRSVIKTSVGSSWHFISKYILCSIVFNIGMNVAIFPERLYFQSVHIHWNFISEMSYKGCYAKVHKSRATKFCTLASDICLFLIMERAWYHTCDP